MHPVFDLAHSADQPLTAASSRPTDAIAVVGCGAGAGASTLVAGLAWAIADHVGKVAVLDLDRYGGGLDVVFGIERAAGVRWAQVAGSEGELDGGALIEALPSSGRTALLSYGREATLVPELVLAASITALSDVCDVLLVDAPRGTDLQLLPAEATVVVVGDGSVRGGAAVGAIVQDLQAAGRDPVVVLRDASRRFADDLAEAVAVQVVVRLASERRVEHDLARGEQPGSRGELATVCRRLARLLLEPGAVDAA